MFNYLFKKNCSNFILIEKKLKNSYKLNKLYIYKVILPFKRCAALITVILLRTLDCDLKLAESLFDPGEHFEHLQDL